MIKKIITLITSFFLFSPVFAALTDNPVPGGIVTLPLKAKSKPELYYHGHRVAVRKKGNQYEAVIGIPLNAKKKQQIVMQKKPVKKIYTFNIKPKTYKVQRLTIKNKRKVTPLAIDKERIESENQDFNQTIAHWQEGKPFEQTFIPPIRGYITSTFGLKRIYNNKPRSPHTALDIAAPTGRPIKATASGQVINVHHRFFTGNTVIIDHGQGVMSLYAHLNSIKVKNGQQVAQGDIIGTVGKTGRVTGPHLHWALYLNQTSVDPLSFVERKAILPKAKKKSAKAKKKKG